MLECFAQVAADYKAVSYTPDVEERKRMQSDTLSAVFETYFRILRHTMQSSVARCVCYWYSVSFSVTILFKAV